MGNFVAKILHVSGNDMRFLAIDKLSQSIPIILTIILLTLSQGDDLGSDLSQAGKTEAGPYLWTDLICLFHHYLYRDRIPSGKRPTNDRPVCQRRECEHDRIGCTVDIGLLFYQWFYGGALVSGCLAGKTYPCAGKDILVCSYRFGVWKHACGCHVYRPVQMLLFASIVIGLGIVNAYIMLNRIIVWGSTLFHAGYDLLTI